MPECSVTLSYPNQPSYKCPVCDLCYSVYSSQTRHISVNHPDFRILCQFQCDACDRVFESKRSVANHHSKVHGRTSPTPQSNPEAGSFICEFCEAGFPSKRSVAQHIRNQHAAEASDQRAARAAISVCRQWSLREHQLFKEALNKFGPLSNIQIANYIGSKTASEYALNHFHEAEPRVVLVTTSQRLYIDLYRAEKVPHRF